MNKPDPASSNAGPAEACPDGGEADLVLVARAQAGDAEAFNELVIRYRRRAFAMIYQLVRNEQDAWDLAQDGFFKAWKSIGRFRGQSAFYTWLYRILMNLTIDFLRQRKAGEGMEFDDAVGLQRIEPAAVTTPKAALAPHVGADDKQIRERIDAAISRLSPEHRAVIVMRELDGLEYQEIAETMGCSLGTVMSRLFYARKKLQTMLRDLYENL